MYRINTPSENLLIAFEGIDGSGKSTLAKSVAEKLGFEYLPTPGPVFKPIRHYFNSRDIDLQSRFLFYYFSTYHSVQEALKRQPGKNFVLDRYILSTRIYHEVLMKKSLKDYFHLTPFPLPHFTFIITARPEIIRHRLSQRTDLNYFEENLELLIQIQDRFVAEKGVIVIENNGDRSVRTVTDEIVSIVKYSEIRKMEG